MLPHHSSLQTLGLLPVLRPKRLAPWGSGPGTVFLGNSQPRWDAPAFLGALPRARGLCPLRPPVRWERSAHTPWAYRYFSIRERDDQTGGSGDRRGTVWMSFSVLPQSFSFALPPAPPAAPQPCRASSLSSPCLRPWCFSRHLLQGAPPPHLLPMPAVPDQPSFISWELQIHIPNCLPDFFTWTSLGLLKWSISTIGLLSQSPKPATPHFGKQWLHLPRRHTRLLPSPSTPTFSPPPRPVNPTSKAGLEASTSGPSWPAAVPGPLSHLLGSPPAFHSPSWRYMVAFLKKMLIWPVVSLLQTL